jgi:transcriptional regulator with GAF, ATPase, and Fis domain
MDAPGDLLAVGEAALERGAWEEARLVVDGDVWGALNVEELERDAFDHDDVILLSTLANQVSAALRAAALLERVKDAEAGVRRVGPTGAG